MSLYWNLFRYRERGDRSPLENFLSESLKDLLDRLSRNDRKLTESFIFEVLLNERRRTKTLAANESLRKFKDRLESSGILFWDRERPFTGQAKRPDISVFVGGKRLLAVEVKVGARLGDEQLANYGKGLVDENKNDLGCALVFLSHATSVPQDFFTFKGESKYGVPLRGACSWTDVYEWLAHVLDKDEIKDALTKGLIAEFKEFLKENYMDTMNEADLTVLGDFLSRRMQPKFEPLFKRTREVIKPLVEGKRYKYKRRNIDPFAYSDGTIVWDWCYHEKASQKPRLWHIGWGLILGGKETFFRIELPVDNSLLDNSLLAFLVIDSDSRTNRLPIGRLPDALKKQFQKSGWIIDEFQMVCAKTKQAVNIAGGSGGFTEGFARWVQESFSKADQLLSKCVSIAESHE